MRGHHIMYDEPLELYIHSIAYRYLNRFFNFNVEKSYALLSCIAGVIYLIIILKISLSLFNNPHSRISLYLICISGGFIQLFFGYVENYTLTYLLLTVYILLSIYTLKGKVSIYLPTLSLSIAFCFHILSGWLIPSLFMIWLLNKERSFIKTFLLIILFFTPIGLTFLYCFHLGYDFSFLAQTHFSKLKFIPLIDSSFEYYQYSIFDLRHITDILNEIILTSLPAFLLLPFVIFSKEKINKKDPYFLFFLIISIFLFIFSTTWNPDLGAYYDWDLFSFISLGYIMLWGYLFIKLYEKNLEKLKYITLIIFTISIIQSFTFILSNANTKDYVEDYYSLIKERAHLNNYIVNDEIIETAFKLIDSGDIDLINIGFEELGKIYILLVIQDKLTSSFYYKAIEKGLSFLNASDEEIRARAIYILGLVGGKNSFYLIEEQENKESSQRVIWEILNYYREIYYWN